MFSFRRHTDKRNGLNIDTREITLEPADNARLLSLCGPFDDNIKQLERRPASKSIAVITTLN